MEFAALALTALALTVAWFLYRSEQLAARHRDLDAALALLRAVEKGMIDPTGWGGIYFEGKNWDEDLSRKEAANTAAAILAKSWNQVLLVPTEPLVLLLGAGALIRDETIAAANTALWRLHVFNQFIRQQADMVGNHAVEIASSNLDPKRRQDLSAGFAQQAYMLHLFGIGGADVPGGWYRVLRDEVRADINHLSSLRARGLLDYEGRRGLLLGDLGFPLLLVATIAVGLCNALNNDDPRVEPTTTSSMTAAP